jgi:hypothetical protein
LNCIGRLICHELLFWTLVFTSEKAADDPDDEEDPPPLQLASAAKPISAHGPANLNKEVRFDMKSALSERVEIGRARGSELVGEAQRG